MAIENLITLPAPGFTLPAVKVPGAPAEMVTLNDYTRQWLVLIFYPRDFSFVCPTELTSFSVRAHDFQHRNCALLGLSVDSIESHAQWLMASHDNGGIGAIEFPLASDADGHVARSYGIWSETERVSLRGTFIIDPEGIVQYCVVHNLAVGRSVDETLRVLEALQSGGLCPASWTLADGNIDLDRALKPGRVLGQYRIVEILGQGSFGSVLAAWDTRLERSVALKVFKRQTREARANVLREARAAAPLVHANICTIYSVDEIDGLLVIAMELLEGQTLKDYLTRMTSLRDRLTIAKGIASGLVVAHSKQVVHSDLKPDNILVGVDLIPRILDFGLADKEDSIPILMNEATMESRAANVPNGPLDKTLIMPLSVSVNDDANGTISGTPAYMAPEQWTGKPSTSANDIYAFGLILFELVTQRPAFAETDLRQLLHKIRDPNLPETISSQLPPQLRELCLAMLASDPNDRPNASAVRDRLDTIISEIPLSTLFDTDEDIKED